MSHNPADQAFNPDDPHHEHEHDHGHTIVHWKTLVTVLVILLAFTALTVSAANAEKWIAASFNIILPQWVNVAVAMSIATVKGVLVMMFFMQLKYDNPFNTIIMLFCFLAFSLFLGFTALDLRNRATIEPWKVAQISAGGMGLSGTPLVWQARINVATRRANLMQGLKASGEPLAENSDEAVRLATAQIAQWVETLGSARYDEELAELGEISTREGIEKFIAAHGLDYYFERLAHYDPRAAGHHASHEEGSTASSAERSRPRTGLSGALNATPSTDHAAPHAGASEHAPEAHAAPDQPAAEPGATQPDANHTEPTPTNAPEQPAPAGHPG